MSQLQRAAGIAEGRILDAMEAAELRDNAKQEFISEFIAERRNAIINNMDRIAELAKEAEDDKYNRLFDAMAELAYSGASKQLQAVIDEIIDEHLEEQAEKEWEAGDE